MPILRDMASNPADTINTTQRRTRPLTLRRKLTFVSAFAWVGLGLLELAARWVSPEDFETWRQRSVRYTWHPEYHWRMQPGDYALAGENLHINRLGLRGPEPIVPKPPGTTRVLVLGGSAVFNAHAPGGRTWPRALEECLRRRLDESIEVVNAGVPGYGIYQSAHRYAADLHALDADLVIVDHLWNDLKTLTWDDGDALLAHWQNVGATNQVSPWMREDPVLDVLSSRIHLASKLRMKMVWRDIERQHIGLEGRAAPHPNGPINPAMLEMCRASYRFCRDEVRSRGKTLILVDQPLLIRPDNTAQEREQIHYRFVGMNHETLITAIASMRATIASLAQDDGVWHVPAAVQVPADLTHFRDHVHLTPAGIEALSTAVGDHLTPIWRDLLPPPDGVAVGDSFDPPPRTP